MLPRSVSTTRCCCSMSSCGPPSSTPTPPPCAGLERRFAERLQIQPSYWSQIKGRSRQIGERLARQFERAVPQACRAGWTSRTLRRARRIAAAASPAPVRADRTPAPQDDDERFIVGLVLTYYRRHPQRARTRLLDLLGEVLTPAPQPPGVQPGAAGRPPAPAASLVAIRRVIRAATCGSAHAGRRGTAQAQALNGRAHRRMPAHHRRRRQDIRIDTATEKKHLRKIIIRLSFAQVESGSRPRRGLTQSPLESSMSVCVRLRAGPAAWPDVPCSACMP